MFGQTLKLFQKRFRDKQKFLTELEDKLSGYGDPGAKALVAQINSDRQKLESLGTKLDVRQALDAGLKGSADYNAAMLAFDTFASEYLASSLAESRSKGVSVASVLGAIAVFFLVGALLWVMYDVFRDKETLGLLGNVPVARGLITFTVTIGTIGVALAMIGATFISQAEDLKDRLSLGNQVLTALIAVLGTIVGFYYGTSDGGEAVLRIVSQQITPEVVSSGGTLSVAANIQGGTVPYSLEMRLEDTISGDVIAAQELELAGSLAILSFDIAQDLANDLQLVTSVTDAGGRRAEYGPTEIQLAEPVPAAGGAGEEVPDLDVENEADPPVPDTSSDQQR